MNASKFASALAAAPPFQGETRPITGFLPGFSVYYTWVVKVDAHNLMGWLRLRMASDAQYEIRVYADAIYREFFKPLLPWTAEAFEQYILTPNGLAIPE